MNIVLELNMQEIKKIENKYKSYFVPTKSPHVKFMAKAPGLVITVYNSGKVMFQGEKSETAASEFGYSKEVTKVSGKQENTIGTDEVGNGSYFGGLAVVASYVSRQDIEFLRDMGVDDSKNLNDTKIRQIAPILEKKIKHVALLVSPTKYNEVIGTDYNAVSIKVALHNQVIFLLEQKLDSNDKVEQVIIDAFTSPANYQKYVSKERNHPQSDVTLIQKAESQFLSVAVSSIIARNLFLENLSNLSKDIGFSLPSGAGSKSDKVAASILKTAGVAGLETTAKLHFKNTEKAKKLAGIK